MESRLSRWCEGLLEAGWLVAVLAIPLFFNIHSERVFEPDKIALLRSIALVMAAGWVIIFIDTRGWRDLDGLRWSNPQAVWHKPFVMAILLLIVIYALATLFSITPRASWAGSYQRLQGTYTTLSYILIFALMAATIRRPEQMRRVVTVAIITSIPVSLYGVLQHFGQDPLPWGGNVQVRVAGHLGNAIFIAAYLIMVLPLTLARIIEAFKNILTDERMAAADIVRASVYIFILAIQLLTIYWSGSRGPLIGLGVGLFAFVLILLVSLRETVEDKETRKWRDYLPALVFISPAVLALLLSGVFVESNPLIGFLTFLGVVVLSVLTIFILVALRRGQTWLWLSWILVAVFMAGWLLLFNLRVDQTSAYRSIPVVSGVLRAMEEWREIPVIGSYGKMLDPTNTTGREKSGRVRVLIWQGVVDLLQPHQPLQYPDGQTDPFNWLRPLIGYGPESMYVAYNAFYPPELATVESRNASPDRSHNETFDTLIITGLAGLVAWQFLYLSVILFAFRYLGVIQSRRDSWMFAGFWIGGAVVAALVATLVIDPIYLGVAVPTGVILGIVVYLIYYALFSRQIITGTERREHALTDRLLMNALVAAVLAHYVEIHFGIAISATRLYFFVFVALIFVLGYRLGGIPKPETITATTRPTNTSRSDRRKRGAKQAATIQTTSIAEPSKWPELISSALLMSLIVGILGYSFITYTLPPDKIITGLADLSTTEIVRQSLLQNPRQDFADWPFVFSMIILAWVLGWVVFLGEMAKHGQLPSLSVPAGRLANSRRLAAAVLFTLMAIVCLGFRFFYTPATTIGVFGQGLAAIAAIPLVAVAILLFLGKPLGRSLGGVMGAGLGLMAFPILFAGFGHSVTSLLPGLVLLVTGITSVWLLWETRWRDSILPVAGLMLVSILVGLLYTYLHAARYRSILFYRPATHLNSFALTRALEAVQSESLLVGFYIFLFLILFLLAFTLRQPVEPGEKSRLTHWAPAPVFGSLIVVLTIAVLLVGMTNMRPIQADMIFKRAKPFDDQATRATQSDLSARIDAWDAAISIYDEAIRRAPFEDYYYLFQGRALLERAALTTDPTEKAELLNAAELLLQYAQAINPLNTDHTANLARLNTRWYAAIDNPDEQQARLEQAERYYRAALVLSPQNSVIRNEYARLLLDLRQDCTQALEIYDESARIDPYYIQTQLARADAFILCSADLAEESQAAYYRAAVASLEEATRLDPQNIRAWVQLAEIERQLGNYESAQMAVNQARALNNPVRFPPAEIDFLTARILAGLENTDEARRMAQTALQTAVGDTVTQIESFLAELETGE